MHGDASLLHGFDTARRKGRDWSTALHSQPEAGRSYERAIIITVQTSGPLDLNVLHKCVKLCCPIDDAVPQQVAAASPTRQLNWDRWDRRW